MTDSIIELEKHVREAEKAGHTLTGLKELKVFERVSKYLDSRELSCDPDNQKQAQRLIITRQLLASLEREIAKLVKDGEYAKIRIKEIEASRRPVERIFNRGY